ncbi:MAG: Spy/CpxP family protein refolding chaperone [Endomicrobia bacterium]|nr:Spy/CpxP family protein refolding chaperone [Endomicrobiia bacterium]
MKRAIIFMLAALFAAAAGSAAFAQDSVAQQQAEQAVSAAKWSGYDAKFKLSLAELDLNDKQKKSIIALTDALLEKHRALRESEKALKAKQGAALSLKKFDEAKAVSAEFAKAEAEKQNAFVDYVVAVSRLLTDKQYKQLNDMIASGKTGKTKTAKSSTAAKTKKTKKKK